MVQEWRSRLADVVVWRRESSGNLARILPDGCMDLIWDGGRLLVAGPDTVAHLAGPAVVGQTSFGLRFGPGLGPALLGVTLSDLLTA